MARRQSLLHLVPVLSVITPHARPGAYLVDIYVAVRCLIHCFRHRALNHIIATPRSIDRHLSGAGPEGAGEWKVIDIGLSQSAIRRTPAPFYLVERQDVKRILKPRAPFSSKATETSGERFAESGPEKAVHHDILRRKQRQIEQSGSGR